MDIRKLQRAIVDGLEDVKAQHIVVYNTEHLSPFFERVIVASGTSNRQTKALAMSVRDAVKSRGMNVVRTEGQDNGEWIIVDCGPAVAHIMQPAIRDYYRLEELWGGKPVRMKIGQAEDGMSAGPLPVPAPKPSRGKAAASAGKRKSASKSAPKSAAGKKVARPPVPTRGRKPSAGASAKRG
jgi:ribosome-associated protein